VKEELSGDIRVCWYLEYTSRYTLINRSKEFNNRQKMSDNDEETSGRPRRNVASRVNIAAMARKVSCWKYPWLSFDAFCKNFDPQFVVKFIKIHSKERKNQIVPKLCRNLPPLKATCIKKIHKV
jgi:hypothetical protein